jgi:hypothetical protein
MSSTTIGNVISRVRNHIKAVHQDAFLTDRYLYSIISKHAKWLMKREDSKSNLMKFNSIMQSLDKVELMEIDRIEAGCTGLQTGIKVMRTVNQLPIFMQGYWGPLIRKITSIDGQIDFQPITPSQFVKVANSKNYKYNRTNYYWYLNNYLYFPDVEWKLVRIEGVFEDDISEYKCIDCDETSQFYCKTRQDQLFNVPDYLFAEIESNVMKDLTVMIQVPGDASQDNQNPTR